MKRRVKRHRESPSRLDDLSKGTHRYFDSYEEASTAAWAAVRKAEENGEQSVDRFYIWNAGVCYAINV